MRAQRFCSRGSSWPFIRNTLYIRRLNGCCSSSEKPFLATTSTSSSSTIATPFSADTDNELKSFGCRVLRTPVQASKANAYCERLIGTIQREFLDWVIPLSEKHLRRMLREWGCTLQSRTPTCKSGTRDSRYSADCIMNVGCRKLPRDLIGLSAEHSGRAKLGLRGLTSIAGA